MPTTTMATFSIIRVPRTPRYAYNAAAVAVAVAAMVRIDWC
jgi:hypothetical protein